MVMRNKNKLGVEALRGRPAKGENRLSISINLKLTPKDYNFVKQKAEKMGLTPTEYARELTLKGNIKSRFTLEELDLMRKLAGMANNLNQLAKQANKSDFSNSAIKVATIANEIKKLLDDR